MSAGWRAPGRVQLGWPVYGPVAYANGALLLTQGTYYQWGMWFEHGFIWWVDYDQATYPDGAGRGAGLPVSRATTCTAMEEDDELIKIGADDVLRRRGALAVNVTVDAYRNDAGRRLDAGGAKRRRHVLSRGLPADDGLATVTVKMHAQGYGGTPNARLHVQDYVWAFRDGTIQPAGTPYADAQMTAIHTYGDDDNKESTYVVRVQVQDEVGFAYGDSLPIVLGHGGGAAGGEIMVIRDDAPTYGVQHELQRADGRPGRRWARCTRSWTSAPTVAADFTAQGFKVAIWYRGGPGAGGEPQPYNPQWTQAEVDNYIQLMTDGHQVLADQPEPRHRPGGYGGAGGIPGPRRGPVYGWTEVDPSLRRAGGASLGGRHFGGPGRGLWHGLLLPAGADELHRRD